MDRLKQTKTYDLFVRIITGISAAYTWYLSVLWSNRGFGFTNPDPWWSGWGMAVLVTVIEIVFTKHAKDHGKNWTVRTFGLLAYLYGIITNFVGIRMQKSAGGIFDLSGANVIVVILELACACIVEGVPEYLLINFIVGDIQDEGDFIRGVFSFIKDLTSPNHQGNSSGNGFRPPAMPPTFRSERPSFPMQPHRTIESNDLPPRKPGISRRDQLKEFRSEQPK